MVFTVGAGYIVAGFVAARFAADHTALGIVLAHNLGFGFVGFVAGYCAFGFAGFHFPKIYIVLTGLVD